jgi:hypothetical protein
MKHGFKLLAVAGIVATLSACGGDGNGIRPPVVTVADLAAGSYIVSVGDANAPTVGKYYAGSDGSRELVLADSNDHATQLYRRAPNTTSGAATWVAVPVSDKDVSVTLLRSDATVSSTLTLAPFAGSYVTQVAAGVTASFTVNATGDIVAGGSACKLSGKLSSSSLPNTLQLSLATVACGTLPATSTGLLMVDADYAPARFRLVADNGTQLLDLWAYAQ